MCYPFPTLDLPTQRVFWLERDNILDHKTTLSSSSKGIMRDSHHRGLTYSLHTGSMTNLRIFIFPVHSSTLRDLLLYLCSSWICNWVTLQTIQTLDFPLFYSESVGHCIRDDISYSSARGYCLGDIKDRSNSLLHGKMETYMIRGRSISSKVDYRFQDSTYNRGGFDFIEICDWEELNSLWWLSHGLL